MEGSIFANEVVRKSNVVGTNTEVEWVVGSLEEKNQAFRDARGDSKVTQVDAFDISGGKGFISKVYKITIHFDDTNREPFLSILKIPGSECILEAMDHQKINMDDKEDLLDNKLLANFHNRECQFYNNFTEIPNLKIVKCYGARDWNEGTQEGALIMDYLGDTGMNVEFIYGLNIHQMRNVLKEIHNLQSYFFSLPNKEWEGEYKMLLDAIEFEKMSEIFTNNWNTIREFVPDQLYKDYETDILALMSNVSKIFLSNFQELPFIEGNMRSFVHGDLWNNNFMFLKDKNGTPLNEIDAIIDWQIIYTGSIGADLARAIVLGCSVEIRREIETVDLPKYYENLKIEVIQRGGQFEMTWDMFKLNYDHCMIDQALQLLMLYGFSMQNHNVPKDRSDYMWNARKYAIGSRIVFAMKDAVKKCRVLKPEWLIPKVKAEVTK
uniref:CHK domain-containing protein n=1 Tax=Rhabditophanes sp. KR3021 TaxID=114890 RepID=A0AC35TGN9_9BILA